jgi:hypothetical protein
VGNDGQGYSNDLGKSFFQPDICVLQVSCSPIHLISSRKTRYILLAEEEKCTMLYPSHLLIAVCF